MRNPVSVNVETCVGCGRCVDICPTSLLALQDGKAAVSGGHCIACGHCEAVCPSQALEVLSLDEDPVEYATVRIGSDWVPYGKPDSRALIALMRSRRSCRNFLDTPVDVAVLQDLAQIGASAPSGTNSQAWTFTILPDRVAVLKLIEEIHRFFNRLNRLAAVPLFRFFSRLGQGELAAYYQKHYSAVAQALAQWQKDKKDRLFFNAPSVMLVGSKPGASTPAEDALLATQNLLLAAHSMGLGTCLIGFATAALKRDQALRKRVGIPEGEQVYAVIAIGHTDQNFVRITRRRKACLRVMGCPSSVQLSCREACEK